MMQAELDKQSLLLQQFIHQKNASENSKNKTIGENRFGSWVEIIKEII